MSDSSDMSSDDDDFQPGKKTAGEGAQVNNEDDEEQDRQESDDDDDDNEGEEQANNDSDNSMESEHEGDGANGAPEKPNRKRKISTDEEEEEEEEEDEQEKERDEEPEDDEEEEEIVRKPRRTKRGAKRSRRRPTGRDFIQDDVEVDDDEDEDDYDYGENDDLGIDPSERAEAERYLKEQEKFQERRRNKYAQMTEEEMERYFQERHAAQSAVHRGDIDEDAYDDITQNGLLPTTKDPNLWIVKCRLGDEKIVVLQLMRKCIAYQSTDEPLQIKAVFAKEGIKGYIYVEAFKKSHVATAVEGIQAINARNINMVDLKEMPDTLKVVRDVPTLKQGTYVRLTRSLYRDDLACVDWVDLAQNKVNLKLVPRIDYTRMRGALRNLDDPKPRTKRRPPQAFFDVDKIKQIGGDVTNDGDFHIFEGGHYRRGFLYKSFPMNMIMAEGIKPSLTELERFQETSDDLKKELESIHLKEKKHNFMPGDTVEVVEGELINLRGKIQSVDGDKVTILPDHEELKDALALNAFELRKHFKVGDHVRVIGGRCEGDTGHVLRVDDNAIILLSDLTNDELKVLSKDLQLCADVTTGVDSIGHFQYQDLVMIDRDTVGVIVRLEREHVEVLTSTGKIMKIRPQSIQCKRDSKYIKAFDSQRNSVQVGDFVRVVDGPFASKKDMEEDKQGQIKHIYRSSVWIYTRKHMEHGGIFVCRAKNLLLVGAKVTDSAPMPSNASDSELLRSPHPLSSPRPNAPPVVPSPRSVSDNATPSQQALKNIDTNAMHIRRNMDLIGKSVRITTGPMKGYIGIVKDATEASVRVELHAQPKTVTVDANKIVELGGKTPDGLMGPNLGGATPTAGYGRTPMYGGSRTPMYGGSATPMHDSFASSRTPHYGSMTPAYGSQTPSHQPSSSWDPTVANTPAHSSHFGDDDFGGGGGDQQGSGFGSNDSFGGSGFGGSGSKFGAGGATPSFGGGGFGASTPGSGGGGGGGFGASTPGSMRSYSNRGGGGGFGGGGFGGGNTPNASTPADSTRAEAGGGFSSTYSRDDSFGGRGGGFNDTPHQGRPIGASPAGPVTLPEAYLNSGEWCRVDLCVLVKRNYRDGQFAGKEGFIRLVNKDHCIIYFENEDETREVPLTQMQPIKPAIGDEAVVIYGSSDDKFTRGTVSGIEGNEVVLALSSGGTKLYSMGVLCKNC